MTTERQSHTGATITQRNRRGTWTIGERLGSGNEGEVYAIANDPARAVKIYHDGKRPGPIQTAKLNAMEGKPPPGPLEAPGFPTLTWPEQLIRDTSTSTLVGFVMPRVATTNFVPIGTYCNPEARQRAVPREHGETSHYSRIVKTAIQNLAQTVHRLHAAGAVIGDINDNNILICPADGFVAMIDCDSFQYTEENGGTTYRCTVGRPEYTAPELLDLMAMPCRTQGCRAGGRGHKATYACVDRDQEHDLFGIAVVIFKLLMDGVHPYDCIVSGPSAQGVTTLKDRIQARYYAYGPGRHRDTRPGSDHGVRYSRLPAEIRQLFERAFA